MTTYRLERLADVDLVFDGELLSEESTWDEHGDEYQRWQDVCVYRTDSDRWVVARIGKSNFPGETDRPTVTVCNSPGQVRNAMTFRHRNKDGSSRSYVTDVCYEALRAAAAKDPRLDEALTVRV